MSYNPDAKRKRKDSNHNQITKCFEKMGWEVLDIHNLKKCADIIIGKSAINIFIEIKDGDKSPSARKLTEGEEEFHDRWPNNVIIIQSENDCIQLTKNYNESREWNYLLSAYE